MNSSPTHFCMRTRANADFSPVDSFGYTGVSNDVWGGTAVSGVGAGTEFQIKTLLLWASSRREAFSPGLA